MREELARVNCGLDRLRCEQVASLSLSLLSLSLSLSLSFSLFLSPSLSFSLSPSLSFSLLLSPYLSLSLLISPSLSFSLLFSPFLSFSLLFSPSLSPSLFSLLPSLSTGWTGRRPGSPTPILPRLPYHRPFPSPPPLSPKLAHVRWSRGRLPPCRSQKCTPRLAARLGEPWRVSDEAQQGQSEPRSGLALAAIYEAVIDAFTMYTMPRRGLALAAPTRLGASEPWRRVRDPRPPCIADIWRNDGKCLPSVTGSAPRQ